MFNLYAHTLINQGYHPIPIYPNSKEPSISQWESTYLTHAQVDRMIQRGFGTHGIGVLAKHTPGVDIDVLDPEISQKLIAWCAYYLPDAVQRIGRAPKSLFLCRTSEPRKKRTSAKYIDTNGLSNQIEILGDGQFFMVYGIHPDTHMPFTYPNSQLIQSHWGALTELTEEHLSALFAYFESIIPAGWKQYRRESRAVKPSGTFVLKPRYGWDRDTLERYLQHIPKQLIDDHDDWIMIGMAIHYETEGSTIGRDIWDAWSQPGIRYDASDIIKRWKSFDTLTYDREYRTAGTIWWFAFGKLKQEKREAFIERYWLIETLEYVYDSWHSPQESLIRLQAFNHAKSNETYDEMKPGKEGKPSKIIRHKLSKLWIEHPERKSVRGKIYDPSQPVIFTAKSGLQYINEFHMPDELDDNVDHLGPVFDHFIYLLPEFIQREWMYSWFAFGLQFPHLRCMVTPLHISRLQGTGRGWMFHLARALFGSWNCSKAKMNELIGEGTAFQDYLHNKLICAVDETYDEKRYAVNDKLRDILTDSHLNVNAKYGAKETITVYTNFFLMSNRTDALVLTNEDRRINVFRGPEFIQDPAYFGTLYKWLEGPGIAQFRYWLRQRDLSGFNWQRSFVTESRTQLIDYTRNDTETFFFEFLETHPIACTAQQLMATLETMAGSGIQMHYKQLIKLLQHSPATMKRLKFHGYSAHVWVFDSQASDTAIRESVEQGGMRDDIR